MDHHLTKHDQDMCEVVDFVAEHVMGWTKIVQGAPDPTTTFPAFTTDTGWGVSVYNDAGAHQRSWDPVMNMMECLQVQNKVTGKMGFGQEFCLALRDVIFPPDPEAGPAKIGLNHLYTDPDMICKLTAASTCDRLTAIDSIKNYIHEPEPEIVVDILSLVDVTVTEEEVHDWTRAQKAMAIDWAGAVHFDAADNIGVIVPEKPSWVPQGDTEKRLDAARAEKDRSEYLTCVKVDVKGSIESWCGRNISQEFHFLSIDHAVLSVKNRDSYEICSDCATKIVEAVADGVPTG